MDTNNRQMVAGNWKMNCGFEQADDLINDIAEGLSEIKDNKVQVVICPPFPYLEMTSDYAADSVFECGAQNVAMWEKGAYTGEVSAQMLKSMNVDYCIVGHSERRKYFSETNQDIKTKIELLLQNNIKPIMCCGESLEQREKGEHKDFIRKEIQEALFSLTCEQMLNVTIAYEPIWAIGTGKTATAAQAQEIHAFIRSILADKWGKELSEKITILYGGSCNATNAKELFALPDVDGGLIGGASLKAKDFCTIVESF